MEGIRSMLNGTTDSSNGHRPSHVTPILKPADPVILTGGPQGEDKRYPFRIIHTKPKAGESIKTIVKEAHLNHGAASNEGSKRLLNWVPSDFGLGWPTEVGETLTLQVWARGAWNDVGEVRGMLEAG
jgi:hypothetical protein